MGIPYIADKHYLDIDDLVVKMWTFLCRSALQIQKVLSNYIDFKFYSINL